MADCWDSRYTVLRTVITVNGVTDTVVNHLARNGITRCAFHHRIQRGMGLTDAVTIPMTDKSYERAQKATSEVFIWNGHPYTLSQLSDIRGVKRATLRWRIRKYGIDMAMSFGKQRGGGRLDGKKKFYRRKIGTKREISYRLGGSEELVNARLRLGWSYEDATTIPALPHSGESKHWRRNQTKGELAALGIII